MGKWTFHVFQLVLQVFINGVQISLEAFPSDFKGGPRLLGLRFLDLEKEYCERSHQLFFDGSIQEADCQHK